ncbi:unnamed protein product [Microthlaspi erraticum]|uniref:F-box domain-containing protein n=1 Tax=Microthlaspi erraticum TaxID=1685480 RepID=A0A6D2IDW3_9BRAS|nr:unnamed protein product [Microthlaspi erraticum]
METLNYGRWSELPTDMLTYVLERLNFVDFKRSKLVCTNWYLCSKQTVRAKYGSPLLMLSLEEDGCVLYNPDEDRVYETTKRDFSGIRFLANSGNWFLVLDSRSNLYIIDVFSDKRIDLPPLESFKGGRFRLKQVGDKEFKKDLPNGIGTYCVTESCENLRGVLWVDEKKEEYIAVWCFDTFLAFCKNGQDYYREIPRDWELDCVSDMVLKGYMLYVLTTSDNILLLDLSGQDGFKDVSTSDKLPMSFIDFILWRNGDAATCDSNNIAVTTSGEILLVHSILYKATGKRIFRVYKTHPDDTNPVKVDSLGDEALLVDLGITVPADHTLGIEPNSIYFTRGDRFRNRDRNPNPIPSSPVDICVYNLTSKTSKCFPDLSNLKLKEARWFFPS